MAVLLVAEHDNAHLKDATHKALTAALAIDSDVHVLVAGNNAGGAAAEAAKLQGVKKVLHCEAPQFERPLAEPMAALIVSLAPATAIWWRRPRPTARTTCRGSRHCSMSCRSPTFRK